jgi:HSP20 family protein
MANVQMTLKHSIDDEIEELQQQVTQRAYELFEGRGTQCGDALADWLTAERELIGKPPVELRENDGTFTLKAALAGVDPKNIDVDITSQDVVIKAETERRHSSDEGHVHQSEFIAGQIFRAVRFPKPVDVRKARAEFRNGLLTVTAPVVPEGKARLLDINAA